MNRKAGFPLNTFHVKPFVPIAAGIVLAAFLSGCQAPQEEIPPKMDVDAVEAIAHSLPYPEVDQQPCEPPEKSQLPSPEEAEEQTGIPTAEAGTSYAEDEVLITLKNGADIADVNQQLSLCDFIRENRVGNEMMVVGEIRNGEIEKGSAGSAVMLVHTAEDVQVNQAIAGLEEMGALKHATPNYLLAAS